MREDDIVWVDDLKIGDLLLWGSIYPSFYMLLYLDKELQVDLYSEEICLFFLDIKNKHVYRHFIEPDDHLACCIRVNKNS